MIYIVCFVLLFYNEVHSLMEYTIRLISLLTFLNKNLGSVTKTQTSTIKDTGKEIYNKEEEFLTEKKSKGIYI